MPQSRLHLAKDDILRFFATTSERRVFTKRDLTIILAENRHRWRLAASTKTDAFITFLKEQGDLRMQTLSSENYGDIARYAWGNALPYEIALSIRPNSYLSHASAVYLHGLTEQLPQTLYVNQEQSEKPHSGKAIMTQEAIDRAFQSKQRTSQYVYATGDHRIVLLSGKNTKNLGVVDLKRPEGVLRVTNLERTLIDIAVRPVYAGGPHQVILAYRSARETVSANALVATLLKLEYLYPYAQAIGFYMERAGYEEARLQRLARMTSPFDFYSMYGMKEKEYDARWKLFHPKGL